MFIAVLILALYFVPFFSPRSIDNALTIDEWAVGLASAAFLLGLVFYMWAPREYIFPSALSAYLLLVAVAVSLVATTGGVGSPFITLWVAAALFASVFGLWGVAAQLLAGLGYGGWLMTHQGIPLPQLVTLALVVTVPLVVSYIIFHKKRSESGNDQTYRALANELNQATTKADVVIRAIDDGVIAVSSNGDIELINPAAQRIIGWQKSDSLGLNYKSVLKLRDRQDKEIDEAHDPVSQVLATNKEIVTDEFSVTTEGGKRRLLALTVSPIGQIGEGAIIVFRDITMAKQEEREQAEFISTASHEMRTPVASIEGYLGLALNPSTATIDDKARDFIQKAHESAQHLGRLFQDLLDVTKADDGRIHNNPKIVDVVAFLSVVAEGIKPRAEEKGLRYFFKPRPDEDTLRNVSPVFYANVDNDHLREVVSNLIENAVKYTPKGDVIIDVSGDDTHVRISVQDSGIGIPPEDISHLFQKFYRVDNSATREIGGTGLGLYLCRRLTEIMGGRIWVESEFGKGSTFFVEFPRIAREEAMHILEQTANAEEQTITPARSIQDSTPTSETTLASEATPDVAPTPPDPTPTAPQEPVVASDQRPNSVKIPSRS